MLLDASASMRAPSKSLAGKTRIEELSLAIKSFLVNHLKTTGIEETGEIAIAAFNGRVRWLNLGAAAATGSNFYRMNEAPRLVENISADGTTRYDLAIDEAYRQIDARRAEMQQQGLHFRYKPQVYLITDGEPTDDKGKALSSSRLAELSETVKLRSRTSKDISLFYSFGVEGADFEVLRKISPYSTYDVGDTALEEVLRQVSESIQLSANFMGQRVGDANLSVDPTYARVQQSVSTTYRGFPSDYAG